MDSRIWIGVAGGAALLLLVWARYANTPDDDSWTDPHQPPAMVPPLLGAPSGRMMRGCPYTRDYPASLAAWDGTVVGDC